MRAQYLIPATEVVNVESETTLLAISADGFTEHEGPTPPGTRPQAPGSPMYN